MTSIDEIERLFEQTPVPCLMEGPHRDQLKQQLLMQPITKLRENKCMGTMWFTRLSPALKIAAAILAASMLVGAGWAAEKLYERLTFNQASLTLETQPQREWTLPNGAKLTVSSVTGTVINPNDPKAAVTAQHHHEEMKELIAKKKYKLLKTFEDESTGGTQYVYTFSYSDGTLGSMNFSMPLDSVSSWEHYEKKNQEQTQRYQEQINRAIAAGKYRLIKKDAMLVQVCKEKDSQENLRVQRISVPKGDIALYRPYDVAAEGRAATMPQSSWQDHLQAIREGKLELLGEETIPNYTYEIVCEDGSKRIFRYGGGKELKGPNPK